MKNYAVLSLLMLAMTGCGLQSQINSLRNDVQNDQSQITTLQNGVSTLQAQSNAELVQLATLQGYTNIVAIFDPCGPQGAYNEVFLKLSTGQYLASFSNDAAGDDTRFALLTDGNYETTDGTNCYFTVSGSGTVISNQHN